MTTTRKKLRRGERQRTSLALDLARRSPSVQGILVPASGRIPELLQPSVEWAGVLAIKELQYDALVLFQWLLLCAASSAGLAVLAVARHAVAHPGHRLHFGLERQGIKSWGGGLLMVLGGGRGSVGQLGSFGASSSLKLSRFSSLCGAGSGASVL